MKKDESGLSNPLADRLNQLIKTKGITKAKMAKICGVTPQSVNNWFVRGTIGKDSAMLLAKKLDVSVAWILGNEHASQNQSDEALSTLSDKEKLLLELFYGLPDSEKDKLIEQLKTQNQHYDLLFKELIKSRLKDAG